MAIDAKGGRSGRGPSRATRGHAAHGDPAQDGPGHDPRIPDPVEPSLSGIAGAIASLRLFLRHRYLPELWDYNDIARWMKISETSVKIRVVTRPDFPEPFMPTGNEEGHRRYFSDEVIAFARRHRGTHFRGD